MIITQGATITAGPVAGLSALVTRSGSDVIHSVTGGAGPGLQAWDAAGLSLLDTHDLVPQAGLDMPRSALPVSIGADPALLVAGRVGIEAVALDPAGLFADGLPPDLLADRPLVALAGLRRDGSDLVVGAGENGLHVWRLTGDARLVAVEALPGVGAVSALAALGQDQLLALSVTDRTLQRLALDGEGRLTPVSQIDTRDGLWVETPTHLRVVELDGQPYALIGARGSGSVSVVALEPGGAMRVTDHVTDERDTRFGGLSVLEVTQVGGQVFVVAGGSDDGLTVMTLLPGGRLVHLHSLADDVVTALADPMALALLPEAEGFDIVVAGRVPDPAPGGSGPGLTRLEVALGPIGAVMQAGDAPAQLAGGAGRDQIVGGPGDDSLAGQGGDDILSDGAGADLLTGGPGRDLFVLQRDGERDIITDFERGIDRLDLADLGRFYSVDAIPIDPRPWGAEIAIGDDRLELRSADGRPLTPADFGIADLRDLSHAPVAPLSVGALRLPGTPGPDILEGRGGNDSIWGGGGRDVLIGQGGDDWLRGDLFAPGFDAVSAQIYRLYQSTLGRNPDQSGLFGWAGQLQAGDIDLTGVAHGLVQSREFQTVYGALSDEGFVTLLYRNVLDRAPDAAGLALWTARLASGEMRREEVVTGFSESPEFVAATAIAALDVSRAGLQAGWSADVFQLYQATLGRAPDLAGFLGWTGQLAAGRGFETIVTGFTASVEFRSLYGQTDDAGFVTLLYANVLGRAPDSQGFALWLERLTSGEMRRETVVTGFSQSPEFIAAMTGPLLGWMGVQDVDDRLDGGTGVNVLQGGILADRFVFRAQDPGHHVIADPEPWDIFAFEGFGYGDRADLETRLAPVGEDLLFSDQGVSVLFAGLSRADLEAALLEF